MRKRENARTRERERARARQRKRERHTEIETREEEERNEPCANSFIKIFTCARAHIQRKRESQRVHACERKRNTYMYADSERDSDRDTDRERDRVRERERDTHTCLGKIVG